MPGMRDSENSLDWVMQARARLMRRRTTKPATKAGQIWALWPEIEAARAAGQSMKSIHKWLQEDAGMTLSLSSLTSYTSRIRRHLAKRQPQATAQAVPSQTQLAQRSPVVTQWPQPQLEQSDPLAQAKRVLSQPKLDIRKLHNDGDPEGSNLI
jgi:hypothetical protein